MNLIVKKAEIADAEVIADLSRSTFYETFAADNTREDMDKFMNETFTKEALMKEVGEDGNYFLLAFDGDTAVGYVRMRDGEERPEFTGRPAAEIARIYAAASAIGKGVGKLLMKSCIELAEELKREIIWLGVWERNERAIEFYKKWGFKKFATHVFQLGSDAQTDWLMMKEIKPAD